MLLRSRKGSLTRRLILRITIRTGEGIKGLLREFSKDEYWIAAMELRSSMRRSLALLRRY
jgi:hypothetical protein